MYTQACCVIRDVSEHDRDWIEQHHAALQRVINDHDPSDEDRKLYLRVLSVWWSGDYLPTDVNFTPEPFDTDDGVDIILAGEEYANTKLMACLVQAFIQDRRVPGEDKMAIEYAYTADDPWDNAYGGGAWLCDGKNMHHIDTRDWLKNRCS